MNKSSLLRLVVFACIGICFSSHNAAFAQTAVTSETAKSVAPREIRALNFVRDDGVFQNKFATLEEALAASRGNNKNTIIKTITSLFYLNSRCDSAAGISYSFTRPEFVDIAEPVKAYTDYWQALGPIDEVDGDELEKRQRAFIDEVQKSLRVKWFPRKVECDAIPIMFRIGNYDLILLEDDDAQNPLIGTKLNDGMMFANLTEKNPFADTVRAGEKDPNFLNKYGYNRFSDAQMAVNAALLQPTKNKLVIYDGTKISLYGFGNFSPNYDLKDAAFDAQFDIFKKAKLLKDWMIVAVVLGQDKVVKIGGPVTH